MPRPDHPAAQLTVTLTNPASENSRELGGGSASTIVTVTEPDVPVSPRLVGARGRVDHLAETRPLLSRVPGHLAIGRRLRAPGPWPDGILANALLIYYICRCICMSSRNIAVQKMVYDALSREKRSGESFTSLFRRLLDQREGLEEIVGSWGRSGARSNRSALRALRAPSRRRSK